ncbi:MAG: immunogenic protein precursor [Alphaproteobacteria bacterium BRH_c36]|nr:MAG: immunogenic protein precursor [Alphaproteobacteria bacterium BRH_c36]
MRYVLLALSLMSVVCLLPKSARAEQTALTLATATKGGGFQLYGNAAADVINAIDPTLRIETKDTKGSLENIPLLNNAKVDLGLVQGVAAHEAFAGIGQPASDLKVIAAIYSSPGMFVVKGGSPAHSVADLTGKPIAWGTPTSGLTLMAKYIMDGLGYDRDNDFRPVFLKKAGDGPALVLDGKVAAFWGAGIGWPGFTKVMKASGRFIGFSEEAVEKVTSKHTFLKAMTVPAGSYEGQPDDVRSIGVWSFILARADLADEVAYRVAKALHKGHAELVGKLVQARETTPENTRAAADDYRIHPGVLKYLKEIGF